MSVRLFIGSPSRVARDVWTEIELGHLRRRDATDAIASAAAGDEYAFRRLIAGYQDDMRRVCAYVTGEGAIAEEATQAA